MSMPAGKMVAGSLASQCLAVLSDGPATSGEVAAIVGITPHDAGTHMLRLFKRGKLRRRPFVKPAGCRGKRHVWLWEAA